MILISLFSDKAKEIAEAGDRFLDKKHPHYHFFEAQRAWLAKELAHPAGYPFDYVLPVRNPGHALFFACTYG